MRNARVKWPVFVGGAKSPAVNWPSFSFFMSLPSRHEFSMSLDHVFRAG
jgi:hypothetical protein